MIALLFSLLSSYINSIIYFAGLLISSDFQILGRVCKLHNEEDDLLKGLLMFTFQGVSYFLTEVRKIFFHIVHMNISYFLRFSLYSRIQNRVLKRLVY